MLAVCGLDVRRGVFYLFPAQTHSPALTVRRKPDKPQLRNILQNASAIFLKIIKVIKDKDSLKNCHSPGIVRGAWGIMTS